MGFLYKYEGYSTQTTTRRDKVSMKVKAGEKAGVGMASINDRIHTTFLSSSSLARSSSSVKHNLQFKEKKGSSFLLSGADSKDSQRKGYVTGDPIYARSKYVAFSYLEIKQNLDIYGVCVVPHLIDDTKCDEHLKRIMDDLEAHIPGFKYANPKTWPLLHEKGKGTHQLILQQWGYGWLQSVVDLRTDPMVVKIFRGLWSLIDKREFRDEDLFSSADAISVSLKESPLSIQPDLSQRVSTAGYCRPDKKKDWLHWDHKPSDPNPSIQGFVNLLNVEKNQEATLIVLT